jgi:hypothetical protein
MLSIGCRSDNNEVVPTTVPTTGPTPSATTDQPLPSATNITPTQPTVSTVEATESTSNSTATPTAPMTPPSGTAVLALSELTSSTCSINNGDSGIKFGTAPGPTPTSVPEANTSEFDDPAARARFLTQARFIVDDLSSWSESFEALWAFDLSAEQQAAALTTLEIRTAKMCRAVDLLDSPSDLNELNSLLKEVVSSRHNWSSAAIDLLIENGLNQSGSHPEGRAATHAAIEKLQLSIAAVDEQFVTTGNQIELTQLDLNVALPAGWYIFGSERSPIITAPYIYQLAGPEGFGPNNWNHGVALRLRRFRNAETLSSEQAAERFGGLISSLGEATTQTSGTALGAPAVITNVEDIEHAWKYSVTVVVVGDNTVVLDYGCPADNENFCGAVAGLVDGITIAGN